MIIIDYSALCLNVLFGQNGDVPLDESRILILNKIREHRKKHKAKYGEVVLACDGWKDLWRKKEFPNYKHSRKKAKSDSKIDFKKMYSNMEIIREEIQNNFPYKVILCQRAEADDVIAQLIIKNQEFGKYEQNIIISADHDFKQLQIYNNVDQWSPTTKKMITENNPDEYLKLHCLTGDSGDGIPNVLSDDDVFLDETRKQIRLTAQKKALLLKDNKALGEDVFDRIQRNKKLIDLHLCPDDITKEIIDCFDEQSNQKIYKSKVLNYLIKNRCRMLVSFAGDFINE